MPACRRAAVAALCALALVASSCGGDPFGGDAALLGHFEDTSPSRGGVTFTHARSKGDLLIFPDGRYLWGTLGVGLEGGTWQRIGRDRRRLLLRQYTPEYVFDASDTASRIVTMDGDSIRIRFIARRATDSSTVVMRRRPAGTLQLPNGRYAISSVNGRPAPRSDTVTGVFMGETFRSILTISADTFEVVAGVIGRRAYVWESSFERVPDAGPPELLGRTATTRTTSWGKLLFASPDSLHWVMFSFAGPSPGGFVLSEVEFYRILDGAEVLARRADFGGIRADVRLRRVR